MFGTKELADEGYKFAKEAVEIYAPLIEKRVKNELGKKISFSEVSAVNGLDSFYEKHYENFSSDTPDSGLSKNSFIYNVASLYYKAKAKSFASSHKKQALMIYDDSKIYISSDILIKMANLKSALNLNENRDYEQAIDQLVVHELSHHLWHNLKGEVPAPFDKFHLTFSESFANYCSEVWFSDLYPANRRIIKFNNNSDSAEIKLTERIKSLVDAEGKTVLSEMPSKYKENKYIQLVDGIL
jgi:hypothetical protein